MALAPLYQRHDRNIWYQQCEIVSVVCIHADRNAVYAHVLIEEKRLAGYSTYLDKQVRCINVAEHCQRLTSPLQVHA